jgi:hypothetical protein
MMVNYRDLWRKAEQAPAGEWPAWFLCLAPNAINEPCYNPDMTLAELIEGPPGGIPEHLRSTEAEREAWWRNGAGNLEKVRAALAERERRLAMRRGRR